MSKVTKAQLTELETLLATLKEWCREHGAPNSIVQNIEDMGKTINWARERKAKK